MKKSCLNCQKEINVKPSHYERKKYCSRKCQTEYQKKNPPLFWEKMRKQREVNCSFCNALIKRKPSGVCIHNFCNRDCKAEFQRKNGHLINQHLRKDILVVCQQCEKEFIVPKNRETTAKYCSKTCLGQANGDRGKVAYRKRIKVNCSECGKKIDKKQSTLRTLNFCSELCMGRYYSEHKLFSGEKSGTWAGGDIDYYGPNWRSQRREARKRDNYTCVDCGISESEYGSELSVHHIIPFRNFNGDWEKANQLSNLVSLCEYPCHRRRHSTKMADDIV